jgi:hypothetical protein
LCDNVGVAGLWWDDELIGYSPGAGFVLTVIVDPVDWAGITAWKARGVDLRSYLEGEAGER